jgi:hypothetical protein
VRIALRPVIGASLLAVGLLIGLGVTAQIASAAPSGCPLPSQTLSSYSFVVTAPGGSATTVAQLSSTDVAPGDTVTANFTVGTLGAGCSSVPVTLITYTKPFLAAQPLWAQVLFGDQTAAYTSGQSGSLTATIPPTPRVGGAISITSGGRGVVAAQPGDSVAVDYDFSMGGNHPAATVAFTDPTVTFAYSCGAGGGSGTFTASMPDAVYLDPAGDQGTVPSPDPTLTYQGTVTVPNKCNSGTVDVISGGRSRGSNATTFTATVTSSDTRQPISVRFQYTDTTTSAATDHVANGGNSGGGGNGGGGGCCGCHNGGNVIPGGFQGWQIDFAISPPLVPLSTAYGNTIVGTAIGLG